MLNFDKHDLNERTCCLRIMGKRSKSGSTNSESGLVVESKREKNEKNYSECSDANNEPKPEETITISEDKKVKRKKKNKSQPENKSKPEETINTSEDKPVKIIKKKKSQSAEDKNVKKNKKIIFNDDDDEPVEVDNPPIQRKRSNPEQLSQENEEDIKDEDIDKFCDELNEEDNEQYESWVKLIEAKLNPNKKKT